MPYHAVEKHQKPQLSHWIVDAIALAYASGDLKWPKGVRTHFTRGTLITFTNDLLLASDQGCISLLVLLDLSAAFDTIDHDILIDRLQNYTGIQGQALRWFRSYLSDRYHFVYLIGEASYHQ